MKGGGKIVKVAFAVVGIATLVVAAYIMIHGLGLQEGLDFGAGSYYYADIPDFDKYVRWDAFSSSLPYWVYVLLFIVWGVLMYLLWLWIDRKGK